MVDREEKRFLASKVKTVNGSTEQSVSPTKWFYNIQMNSNYKQDETKLRKVISDNVHFTTESPMKLLICYRNRNLSSLFIKKKNNPKNNSSGNHVVYRYTCRETECEHGQLYTGYIFTTLKQRMTTHAQNGSILVNVRKAHKLKLKTQIIHENVKVIYKSPDKMKLIPAEALLIKERSQTLNKQKEGETRMLKKILKCPKKPWFETTVPCLWTVHSFCYYT